MQQKNVTPLKKGPSNKTRMSLGYFAVKLFFNCETEAIMKATRLH